MTADRLARILAFIIRPFILMPSKPCPVTSRSSFPNSLPRRQCTSFLLVLELNTVTPITKLRDRHHEDGFEGGERAERVLELQELTTLFLRAPLSIFNNKRRTFFLQELPLLEVAKQFRDRLSGTLKK